jgi:hypothetical protein
MRDGFTGHYTVDFLGRNEGFVGDSDKPYKALLFPPIPSRPRERGQCFGLLEGIGAWLRHRRGHRDPLAAKRFGNDLLIG